VWVSVLDIVPFSVSFMIWIMEFLDTRNTGKKNWHQNSPDKLGKYPILRPEHKNYLSS